MMREVITYLTVNSYEKLLKQCQKILDSNDYKTVHDEYIQLRNYVDSLSHEVYTTTDTPPENQKDGDYWTRLL